MQLAHIKTRQLLLIWLLVIPPTGIYLVMNYRPAHFDLLTFIGILLFAFLSSKLPVKLKGEPLRLVLWITIPAFLLYGLLIEIIVMQVIVFTRLLSVGKGNIDVSKVLLTSLSFFFISFISAIAFHFAGGEIGMVSFWPLLVAIIAYQFAHRVTYIILYVFYSKLALQFKGKLSRHLLLEGIIAFLILPFTLTLYFLINYVGIVAFLLLGIPFFFLLVVWRRYNNAEKINVALEQASVIGLNLSHFSTEEKVINEFVKNVSRMFTADFTYLYDSVDDWLEPLRIYENDTFQPVEMKEVVLNEEVVKKILKGGASLIYERREDWICLSEGYKHPEMQSMFAIPITRDKEVKGLLVVASKRKHEFKQYDLQIAELLCSYFAVLVVRARHMEQTTRKSECCGLTSLYNYNYLEERLRFEYNRLTQKNNEPLTVLMLDIDYFKKVNDAYGHENGNVILIELAKILASETPQNGIVGRYGGEEFLYILPSISKEEGIQFGERLRELIEAYRFKVTPDLSDSKEPIDVSITVSIGVSSIPQDTDELNSLIRNADRALYLGAKRTGRNRVAAYVQ